MRRLFQHCRREEAIYLNTVNFSTATVFLYYFSQNNCKISHMNLKRQSLKRTIVEEIF